MSNAPELPVAARVRKKYSPFRRAVLRGLAFVLPPLLTLVFFIWVWSIVERYLLRPAEGIAATGIVWSIKDVKSKLPADLDPVEVKVEKDLRTMRLDELLAEEEPAADIGTQAARKGAVVKQFQYEGHVYVAVKGKWIPEYVYKTVDANPGDPSPVTADKYYDRYVRLTYLRRSVVVPVFVCVLTLVLYMTGKIMAAGVGRFALRTLDGLISRMPIIRDVYSGVKQMTELLFSEHEVQYMRVVAIEYPRKGIWALAFVMGEGFRQIRDVADEPIYSVLIPTSPTSATGPCLIVKRSECLELDVTIDQAVQFIVSCGVVVPPEQRWQRKEDSAKVSAEVQARLNEAVAVREGAEAV